MKKTTSRRSMLKSLFGTIFVSIAGTAGISHARPSDKSIKRVNDEVGEEQGQVPLIAQHVVHGGLVYVKGMGEHDEMDITKATTAVLDKIEEQLIKAGSSMNSVLKVNVFLADLADYSLMNEAYRGRFGENPPVRTTVACYAGIPGNSLVEIDCIAAVEES